MLQTLMLVPALLAAAASCDSPLYGIDVVVEKLQ